MKYNKMELDDLKLFERLNSLPLEEPKESDWEDLMYKRSQLKRKKRFLWWTSSALVLLLLALWYSKSTIPTINPDIVVEEKLLPKSKIELSRPVQLNNLNNKIDLGTVSIESNAGQNAEKFMQVRKETKQKMQLHKNTLSQRTKIFQNKSKENNFKPDLLGNTSAKESFAISNSNTANFESTSNQGESLSTLAYNKTKAYNETKTIEVEASPAGLDSNVLDTLNASKLEILSDQIKKSKANPSNFYISSLLSGSYNYYQLKANNTVGNRIINEKNNASELLGNNLSILYSIGLRAGYVLNTNWSIEAGAFYSKNKRIQSKSDFVDYKIEGSSSSSYINYEYQVNTNYLIFSTNLRYNFLVQGNKFYCNPGLSYDFNIVDKSAGESFFYSEVHKEGKIETKKVIVQPMSFALSYNINLGYESPLHGRYTYFLELGYFNELGSMLKPRVDIDLPLHHYLRKINLGIGINYFIEKKLKHK